MKIRKGFVTNSSSSSFIVSLNNNWSKDFESSINLDACAWEYLTLENYHQVLKEWLIYFSEVDCDEELEYYFDSFQLPDYELFRKLMTVSEFSDKDYEELNATLNNFKTRETDNYVSYREQQKALDSNKDYIIGQQPYMAIIHQDGTQSFTYHTIYNREYKDLSKTLNDKYREVDESIEEERNKFCNSFFEKIKQNKDLAWKFMLILADCQINCHSQMVEFYLSTKEHLENGESLLFMEVCEGDEESVSEEFANYGKLISVHHNR